MSQEQGAAPSPRANAVLALLLLAYIFNFLDRQILGILAGPIIADLKLTDAEFGAIGGIAFAMLYSVLGVPLAMLADRTSRSRVIAGAVAVWSAFTALCGTAASFGQLFFFRLGVGVGEAGGVAPVLCADRRLFPAAPARPGAGHLFARHSAGPRRRDVDRRLSRLLDRLARRLPGDGRRRPDPGAGHADLRARPASRRAGAGRAACRCRSAFPIIARKPTFWLMAAAASCSSLAGYGLALWTPSVLERSFGFSLIERGQFLASIFLIGGTTGVFLGGWLADRLGQARPALVCAAAGNRLADHRADLCDRPAVDRSLACLAAAAHPQRAQHPVAGPGGHRRPASGAAADALDRLGQLPADQQSDRPWRRADADRRAVGAVQGAFRHRGACVTRPSAWSDFTWLRPS